ncbi:MAG: hypothetical protein Q7J80_07080 [Anaerolineales bacterium]|nr:hypothetical protein [Anaerolineales bacterium]
MKKRLLSLAVLLLATLACGFSNPANTAQPDVETIVAATMQALTTSATSAPPLPTLQSGVPVSGSGINLVIPSGLGSGVSSETISKVTEESGAPWEVAPAYTKLTLEGYPLQAKFFKPLIMVYPTAEFEAVSVGAAQSLAKLRAILASPSAPLTDDLIPGVPTFNAGQVFVSNMQLISFQNGSGVRVLTQYAQYFAPANNFELSYQYQGLTADGQYYVIALLPVNVSFLAADDKPDAAVPANGVPLPANGPDENYYAAVIQKLNGTSPDSFSPSLTLLDALIQSINIISQ